MGILGEGQEIFLPSQGWSGPLRQDTGNLHHSTLISVRGGEVTVDPESKAEGGRQLKMTPGVPISCRGLAFAPCIFFRWETE